VLPSGIPKPGPLQMHPPDDHMRYAIIWFSLAGLLLIAFAVWLRGRAPALPDVGFWRHFSDMAAVLSDVRCWRQSRKHLLLASISPFDPNATSRLSVGPPPDGFFRPTKAGKFRCPQRRFCN
jgi:hypothetical protein